jgi:xanthine dehydrogenase accessory factor
MQKALLELAADLARRGEPFVLALVVARDPPISAKVGDAALVTRDGGFHGWVGGSCTQPTVVAEAKKALADGRPRMIALGLDSRTQSRSGVHFFPMTCHSGGSVEIHIQPVLPQARLVIYGASPIATALSRLGNAMGYEVHACDPSGDSSAFPGATSVVKQSADLRFDRGAAPVFAVAATHGQWDEEAVAAALALAPDYLSVVASRKRFASLQDFLREKLPEAMLSRIKNPAGLDIGAVSAEEIALSILAEVVRVHRRNQPALASGEQVETDAQERGAAAPRKLRLAQVIAPEAKDPVCGMSVRVEGAAFRTTHRGQEFYFCCGGCRDRFSATPERYLAAGAAP